MLIDFFCDGLNQTVRSKVIPQGPRSSLSNFLDYVLLTVGSAFTVGVAEERDTAPQLYDHSHARARSQNGGDSGARSQNGGHNNTRHVIAASHESIQVSVDVNEPSKFISMQLWTDTITKKA